MEDNPKLRMAGAIISSLAIFYYLIEIAQQIKNWYSYSKISELTKCPEVFGLEIWLITQSIIWCGSLFIILIIFLFPHLFKLMLCFMYLVGPLFFLWTISALVIQISFINCCANNQDNCENFYPYKYSANFIVLLIVSLLFSIAVSILLISILVGVFWGQIRSSMNRYEII